MRKFSLILFLTISNFCFGQNWELFKANETYNFNFDNIHGVRVDSVKSLGNDTIFYFNRTLNDSVFYNLPFFRYPVQYISKPNIFGSQAIQRHDSVIFTNRLGEKLYIKPKSPLNYIWNLVEFRNTKIEAYVDSVYIDTIRQVQDSIKRIVFQFRDSSNNLINHSINSERIFISKSNGFVNTFSLYDHPLEQSVSYRLRKFNQLFKTTTFTNAEVFDLNIGDEYHFMLNDSPPNTPPGHDIYNHVVTTKTSSANGDTIRLRILEHREKRTSTVDFTTNPPTLVYNTTNSSRSLTRAILHPNATFNSDIGFEVKSWRDTTNGYYDSVATTTGYSHYLPFYNTNTYNNRVTINPENYFFAYDSTWNSWIVDNSLASPYSNHYLIGVFNFTNYWNNQSGGGGYPEYYSMIYFKKGNETWGTPRLVTGIEDQMSNEERVYLYPNPANELIQIETSGTSFKEIHVFDMRGRVIQVLPFQNNLNVSEFENGLYLLKLIGQDKVVDLKFVKR